MAFVNPNKPAGLSPVRYLNGAKYDGKFQIYCILAADTNGFWPGDIVKAVANGDASGIPAVTKAAASDTTCIGVVVAVGTQQYGAYVNPNALQSVNRPAAAQAQIYYVAVSDDPNIIYEIQEGGTGTNLTQTSCNRNGNFVVAAPATGVAVSGTQLDNTLVATTATLPLKLLRLAPRIDNHFVTSPTTGGGAQKWWVMFNQSYFKAGTASL